VTAGHCGPVLYIYGAREKEEEEEEERKREIGGRVAAGRKRRRGWLGISPDVHLGSCCGAGERCCCPTACPPCPPRSRIPR